MARFMCLLAVVVLAMMLFVAYDVEAAYCARLLSKPSYPCYNEEQCSEDCKLEGMMDGACNRLLQCTCVYECAYRAKNEAAILSEEAKTFAAALLEEDIME